MGITRGRTAIDGFFNTTLDLISYKGKPKANQLFETDGFTTSGDGGGAKWQYTGNTIAASQTPVQTGTITCSDANGNEYKLIDSFCVNLNAVGMVNDGKSGTSLGTDNSTLLATMLQDLTITRFTCNKGVYFFGSQVTNETTATRTTIPVHLDFKGSELIINTDNTVVSSGSVFIEFLDVSGSMINYIFNDIGFTLGVSLDRGCIPLLIKNVNKNTEGYVIGNSHVISGQSLFTCVGVTPFLNIASHIRIVGKCSGDNVYYGVNLAGNGCDVVGSYRLNSCERLVFIYNVRDIKLKGICKVGLPSSGNINISNRPEGRATENCELDMSFDKMDGPVDINTLSTNVADDGKGAIKNVKLKLRVDTIGSNLTLYSNIVVFLFTASTGATLSTGTATIDNINLELITELNFVEPVRIISHSPNYGLLILKPSKILPQISSFSDFTLTLDSATYKQIIVGDTTTMSLAVSTKNLSVNTLKRFELVITAQESTAFFGFKALVSTFILMGFVSSNNLTLLNITEINKTVQGAATPSFSISTSGSDIIISVSGFASNQGGQIVSSIRDLN